mgnify:CR=1 FL=1
MGCVLVVDQGAGAPVAIAGKLRDLAVNGLQQLGITGARLAWRRSCQDAGR